MGKPFQEQLGEQLFVSEQTVPSIALQLIVSVTFA